MSTFRPVSMVIVKTLITVKITFLTIQDIIKLMQGSQQIDVIDLSGELALSSQLNLTVSHTKSIKLHSYILINSI